MTQSSHHGTEDDVSVQSASTSVKVTTEHLNVTVRSFRVRELVKTLISLGPFAVTLTAYGLLVDHLPDSLFNLSWLKFVFSGLAALLIGILSSFLSRRLARLAKFPHTEPRITVVAIGRTSIPQIFSGARKRLIGEIRTSSDKDKQLTGWPQYFGTEEDTPTAIGTSYGLRLLNVLDTHDARIDRSTLVESIIQSERVGGGWAASSQRDVARPEVTAWVLSGAIRGGLGSVDVARLKTLLHALLSSSSDLVGPTSTSVITTSITTLAEIDPSSHATRGHVERLLRGTQEVAEHPEQATWGAKLSLKAKPSVAHTARAVLALTRIANACQDNDDLSERCRIASLRGARWICSAVSLAQFVGSLENREEQIRRPFPGGQADVLVVGHFTAAWVARCLIAINSESFEPYIRVAVDSVVQQQKKGIWRWEDSEPVWMTYQGVATLREYSLRCLPWPP